MISLNSSFPSKVRVNLRKYRIKDAKVGYPISLKTKYQFDEVKQELIVSFDEIFGARIFELETR